MTPRLLLAASLLLAVPTAYAQVAPPPASNVPAAAPAPRAPRASRGPERPMGDMHDRMHGRGEMGEMGGPMGGGLPHGTWWRNPEIVSRIALTADQQKRIDDLFLQSKVQLIHIHATLEEAQLMLEPLLNANPVDQAKAMVQIGKIADTRAELEKTDARMLLSIRAVLNADQWTKLREGHRGMEMGPGPMGSDQRGPRGAGQRGPMGKGGPGMAPPPQ